MTAKLLVGLALLLGATTFAAAQSQPNYGPNGPGRSDCFGQPYSGSAASRCGGGYSYHRHWR
jgi:hypothetical protein